MFPFSYSFKTEKSFSGAIKRVHWKEIAYVVLMQIGIMWLKFFWISTQANELAGFLWVENCSCMDYLAVNFVHECMVVKVFL